MQNAVRTVVVAGAALLLALTSIVAGSSRADDLSAGVVPGWDAVYSERYAKDAVLAVTDDGFTAVAATVRITLGNTDYLTVRYDEDGGEDWTATYDGGDDMLDELRAVAVDSSGRPIVTGRSQGADGDWDWATVKYSTGGTELWARRYDGAAETWDEATGIAVDDADNVYVTGASTESGTWDLTLIKYSSGGTAQWTEHWAGPDGAADDPRAIAVDSARNIYVTGGSGGALFVVKYSTGGTRLWARTYDHDETADDAGRAIAVNASGAWVAGRSGGATYLTVHYDASGDRVWESAFEASGEPTAIGVTAGGRSIVTGSELSYLKAATATTVSYDDAGGELWSDTVEGTAGANALVVDVYGNAYVAGARLAGAAYVYRLAKLDPDGAELWVEEWSGAKTALNWATDVDIDDDGSLTVTGSLVEQDFSDAAIGTVRYDLETCDGCVIAFDCYEDGEPHPDNPCLSCDVAADPDDWSFNTDPCDDGIWCNGDDTCSAGSCSDHAGDPCPDDGLWCNGAESCDEDGEQCLHETTPEELCPDDGLWCNGIESCDEDADACTATADPCPDDGLWCNGAESCDDETDQCLHETTPEALCPDDGLWCNGAEICDDEADECSAEAPVCDPQCQECDEETDRCSNVEGPCDDGVFCNGDDTCVEGACDDHAGDPCEDDGAFCNGTESCDETAGECVHSGDPCEDDGLWCTGDEVCNESADLCQHQNRPCGDEEQCIEQTRDCRPLDDDDDDDDDSGGDDTSSGGDDDDTGCGC